MIMQNTFNIGNTVCFTKEAKAKAKEDAIKNKPKIENLSCLYLTFHKYNDDCRVSSDRLIDCNYKISYISDSHFGLYGCDYLVPREHIELFGYAPGDIVRYTKEIRMQRLEEFTKSDSLDLLYGDYEVMSKYGEFVDSESYSAYKVKFKEKEFIISTGQLELVSKAETPTEEEQIKEAPDMKVVNLSRLTIGDKFANLILTNLNKKIMEEHYEDIESNSFTSYQKDVLYLRVLGKLKMISILNKTKTTTSYRCDKDGTMFYTDQDGVEYPESVIVKVEEEEEEEE